MQITITQNEIEQAIEDFVKSQVTINDDQTITMELKATRGETGFQAVIDITAAKPAVEDTPKARKPRAQKTQEVNVPADRQNGNMPAGEDVKDAPESDNTPVEETEVPEDEKPEQAESSPPSFLKQGSIFGNAQTA